MEFGTKSKPTPLDMWRATIGKPKATLGQVAHEIGKDETYVLSTPPSIDPFAKGKCQERKIITVNNYPPIPVRHMDWLAYYDDEGAEAGRYGYGRTEEAAIYDLRSQYGTS